MSAKVHKLLRVASRDRRHTQRSHRTKLKQWWHSLTKKERWAARLNILSMHQAVIGKATK